MKKLIISGILVTSILGASSAMACLTCGDAEPAEHTAVVGTMASITAGANVDGGSGAAFSGSLSKALHSQGIGFWGVSGRAWEASGDKGAGVYFDKHFFTDNLVFTISGGAARVEKTLGGWETKPAARGEVVLGNVVLGYNHVFSDSSNHDYVDIGLKFAW